MKKTGRLGKSVLISIILGCLLGQAEASPWGQSIRNIMRVGQEEFYGDGSCPPFPIDEVCSNGNEICQSVNKITTNLYYTCPQ